MLTSSDVEIFPWKLEPVCKRFVPIQSGINLIPLNNNCYNLSEYKSDKTRKQKWCHNLSKDCIRVLKPIREWKSLNLRLTKKRSKGHGREPQKGKSAKGTVKCFSINLSADIFWISTRSNPKQANVLNLLINQMSSFCLDMYRELANSCHSLANHQRLFPLFQGKFVRHISHRNSIPIHQSRSIRPPRKFQPSSHHQMPNQ